MENMKRKDQIILLTVIGVLLVLFVVSMGWLFLKNSSTTTPASSNIVPESGNVMLSFKPNILPAKIGQTITSNITYDAGTNPTSNLIIKISYNPKLITNVQVTPFKDSTSAISYSLEKNSGLSSNSPKNGTVTLALSLVKGAVAQKGRGIVGHLTATVLSAPTTISFFSDTTAVSVSNTNLSVGRINLDIIK